MFWSETLFVSENVRIQAAGRRRGPFFLSLAININATLRRLFFVLNPRREATMSFIVWALLVYLDLQWFFFLKTLLSLLLLPRATFPVWVRCYWSCSWPPPPFGSYGTQQLLSSCYWNSTGQAMGFLHW